MEKIKWGIIGPGSIANNFADGLTSSYSGQLLVSQVKVMIEENHLEINMIFIKIFVLKPMMILLIQNILMQFIYPHLILFMQSGLLKLRVKVNMSYVKSLEQLIIKKVKK